MIVDQAVRMARSSTSTLPTYTDGSDVASQVETWLLQDPAVQEHLTGLQAILLRLPDNLQASHDDASTQDARNFRQLYPTTTLPTVISIFQGGREPAVMLQVGPAHHVA